MTFVAPLLRRRAAQLASLDAAQRSRNRFEVRVIFWGFVVHTLVQVTYIACPLPEFAQRVLSIFGLACLWLFPLCLPAVWDRYRAFLVSFFKVIFFSFPNLRKPAGVQNALNRPAMAHPLGALIDVIRMVWAARLFAVYIFGLALPVEPLPQGLVQLYCTACVRTNPTLCASQLMRDSLTVGRLRDFIALSSAALLPSAVVGAPVGVGEECSFAYSLLALVVGVVAPTLPLMVRKVGPLALRDRVAFWWVAVSAAWVAAAVVTSLTSEYF